MDILDILLDDDGDTAPADKKAPVADDREGDMDLLLEEFSNGDLEAKKASLRALISLMK